MGSCSDQHRIYGSDVQDEAPPIGFGSPMRCKASGHSSPVRQRRSLLQCSPSAGAKPQWPQPDGTQQTQPADQEQEGEGGEPGEKDAPRVRVGDEFQAAVPTLNTPLLARDGKGPRPPTLLYAPGGGSELLAAAAAAKDAARRGPGAHADAQDMGAGSAQAERFFVFPLPPPSRGMSGPGAVVGSPDGPLLRDVVEEKRLRWQIEQLGFTQCANPIPPALRVPGRGRDWSAQERRIFEECLHRHGKRFRDMVPELPGRTVAELVEAYYRFKTHKRLSQIDATQATRNVRQGSCGALLSLRPAARPPQPRAAHLLLPPPAHPTRIPPARRDDWVPPTRQAPWAAPFRAAGGATGAEEEGADRLREPTRGLLGSSAHASVARRDGTRRAWHCRLHAIVGCLKWNVPSGTTPMLY